MSDGPSEVNIAEKDEKGEKKQSSGSTTREPSVKVFPVNSVRRIIEMEMKESRTVSRVSSDASIVLYGAILSHGRRIAKRAVEYAIKGKRKTVSGDDIKRAIADILV